VSNVVERLVKLYRVKYPHNPIGVLKYHIGKLTRTGLNAKTAIIILAVENGIEIGEVSKLMSEGYSLREAAKIASEKIEVSPDLIDKLAQYMPVEGYLRTVVSECKNLPVNNLVVLHGRIIGVYVGRRLHRDLISDIRGIEAAQFTLRDPSGMILIEVAGPVNITLMRGSVVRVEGRIARTSRGEVYVIASNVVRLQPIEDYFNKLSNLELFDVSKLPISVDGVLVKPYEGKVVEAITVGKSRRLELAIIGVILCALAFAGIPVFSIFACCAGLALIVYGLISEAPEIKSYEIVRFLARMIIEHHPPWLRSRCLKLNIGGRQIYLCARCTGTLIGYIFTKLIQIAFPSILIAAALGLPALLDWSTQKLGFRESSNLIRILTGLLLGSGIALSLNFNFIERLIVILSYLSAMLIISILSIKEVKFESNYSINLFG